MTRLTLIHCLLLAVSTSACISTKDVGVGEDTGGQGSSSSAGESEGASTDASATAPTSASASGSSSSGEASTGSGEDTGSDTDSASTAGVTSDTSSESESDGPQDEMTCLDTGGTWVPEACGHYTCGIPQDCQAVIPGCDCGPFRVFASGVGCFVDDKCETAEFACGPEATCTAPGEFCDVFQPGVKGADIEYDCLSIPDDCVDDYSCACLETTGIEGECMTGEDGTITVTLAGA